MPKKAFAFGGLVVLIGAAVVACAAVQWRANTSVAFLVCALLAILAATLKVQIPGMTGTISPVAVPILLAAGTLSWQQTVIVSVIAAIVQSLWRPVTRPAPLQVAFNGAALAIAGALASKIPSALAPRGSVVCFLIAAIVFQSVNTLLISMVLSLIDERVHLRVLWRNCHLWSFFYEIAAGGFAAIWAQTNFASGSQASVFSIFVMVSVSLYLMSTCYREIVARIMTSRTA